MINRVVFWEPSASPHKFQLYEELARLRPDIEFICFCAEDLSTARRKLGWSYRQPVGFCLSIAPGAFEIGHLIDGTTATMHVFTGIRHYELLEFGVRECLRKGSRFLILSEPRVAEGFSGLARRVQSLFTERYIARKCEGVLAIGRHGPPWFAGVGYRASTIFPFAYFVDPPDRIEPARPHTATQVDAPVFGFLGRLDTEKGFKNVLDLFSRKLQGEKLVVAGTGALQRRTVALYEKGSISGAYLGIIPIEATSSFFSRIDVLLAPSVSTNDGWGVVVSEALMHGVPVVVSPRVGSSICFGTDSNLGVLMRGFGKNDLADAIDGWIAQRKVSSPSRTRLALHCEGFLSARAGAIYLSRIFNYLDTPAPGSKKPCPPWEMHQSNLSIKTL